MSRSAAPSICLLSAIFSGCAILPFPTKEHGLTSGRGQILPEELASLEKGKTTREEVLLRYGEPSLVLNDQKILVYKWMVLAGGYVWVVVIPPFGGAVGGGDIPKEYVVTLEFDGEGRLVRFELSGSIWSSSQSRINERVPPESEKLSSSNSIVINPTPVPNTECGVGANLPQGIRVQVRGVLRPAGRSGEWCPHRK